MFFPNKSNTNSTDPTVLQSSVLLMQSYHILMFILLKRLGEWLRISSNSNLVLHATPQFYKSSGFTILCFTLEVQNYIGKLHLATTAEKGDDSRPITLE